jgi:hypothetical protein
MNAWAVHREAIDFGVTFSLNDRGKLSVGNCHDLPLLRKLRVVKNSIEGYVICDRHDEPRVPVPPNPKILRCGSCEQGSVERAKYAVDHVFDDPKIEATRAAIKDGETPYGGRVRCPTCNRVTKTFSTRAADGCEITRRVAGAATCEACEAKSKR